MLKVYPTVYLLNEILDILEIWLQVCKYNNIHKGFYNILKPVRKTYKSGLKLQKMEFTIKVTKTKTFFLQQQKKKKTFFLFFC